MHALPAHFLYFLSKNWPNYPLPEPLDLNNYAGIFRVYLHFDDNLIKLFKKKLKKESPSPM